MKSQITETITIAQAKTALAQAAVLYFQKGKDGRYLVDRRRARPICLMGPAGLGKTEIVRQVAEEQGLAFLSYSITHHTRQSAVGLPRLTERVIDGKTVSVTEYTMSEIIAEVYRCMDESGKREGILFLDEFNCASETMRPILLQLLQSKSFGPHEIPDGWLLVLAGNPPEYNAAVSTLDAVTADRMRLLWLRPDYAAWRAYVSQKHIHPLILAYLDDHKNQFYLFENGPDGTALVTARAWEDLSVMLRMMEEHGFAVDLAFVAQYLQSAAVAQEFQTYYCQYEDLIASDAADDILRGKNVKKCAERVKAMPFARQWALSSLILRRIEMFCGEDVPGAAEMMNRAITFYRGLSSMPQLEFLVGGITASDECAKLILRDGCPAYRETAGEVFLNDAPRADRLRQALPDAG